jgi:endonuclease/exonuclease/phosphatase family metal-dependent hydrolase
VITWNVFHAQAGETDPGFTVNRKLTPELAAIIARARPDVAALQEVPLRACATIARLTGMQAAWVGMPPLIGPAALRGWLAERNPRLWRSHEGTANMLLTAPHLRQVPGSFRTLHLNPLWRTARRADRLRISLWERRHWMTEPRFAIAGRVEVPGGAQVEIATVHCHNARDPRIVDVELERLATFLLAELGAAAPAILAGDLNARWSRNAAGFAWLAEAGFTSAAEREGPEPVDHVMHRGMDVVAPPRPWPRRACEVLAAWDGRWGRVLVSDHVPVEGSFALPRPARHLS